MFENFNISENNLIIVELAKVLRYLTKGPSCPFSRVSQLYHNCPRSIQDLLKPQASWFSTSYYNENQRKSLIPRHWFVTNCGLVLCKYLILLIMGIPVLKIFQNQRTIASKCLKKKIQITDGSRLKMGFLAKLVNCHWIYWCPPLEGQLDYLKLTASDWSGIIIGPCDDGIIHYIVQVSMFMVEASKQLTFYVGCNKGC
jgi:hypothetical protein